MGKNYVHINDTNKTVLAIATVENFGFGENDSYHNEIRKCAEILLDLKAFDAWVYHTNYGSGTCVFRSPDTKKAISVNPYSGDIS